MNAGSSRSIGEGSQTDLIARMRRAHDQELAASAEAESADAETASISSRSLREAEEIAAAETDGQLARKLLGTARRALEERFEGGGEIRGAIVDAIVDSRYGDVVEGEGREEIVAAVKETLDDDPGFRREVDNMMLKAARQLGRAQGPGE